MQTQSLASALWRRQVKDFLRAYIAHLREIGIYDSAVAFQIAAGSAGEWIESWSSMHAEALPRVAARSLRG